MELFPFFQINTYCTVIHGCSVHGYNSNSHFFCIACRGCISCFYFITYCVIPVKTEGFFRSANIKLQEFGTRWCILWLDIEPHPLQVISGVSVEWCIFYITPAPPHLSLPISSMRSQHCILWLVSHQADADIQHCINCAVCLANAQLSLPVGLCMACTAHTVASNPPGPASLSY